MIKVALAIFFLYIVLGAKILKDDPDVGDDLTKVSFNRRLVAALCAPPYFLFRYLFNEDR